MGGYLLLIYIIMEFELSCEEVGEIHISCDEGVQDALVEFLEQEQDIAVVGSY